MLTYFAHSRHSVNICWMFHSLTYSFLGPSANKTPIPYSGWRWGCLVNFTSSLPHRERRSRDQACRRYQWVFHERKMIQFQHCSAPSLLLSFCLKYSDCAGGRGARGGGKEDGQQKPSCSLEDRSIQGRRSCKREACLRWQHRAGLPSLNAQTQYSSLHENDPANSWKLILVWRKTEPVSLAAICTFSPMTILCVPSDVVSMPSPGHAVSMASSTTNTLMSLAPSS